MPVRYKITANKNEGSDFTANIVITWLLHILNIHVKYLKELFYYVRIFIIPVYKSDNLKKKKNQAEESAVTDNSNNDYVKETSAKQENNNSQELLESKDVEEASNRIDTEQNTIVENNSDENTQITNTEVSEDSDEEKSLIDKIFIFTEKVIDFFFNIGDRIETIANKITDIFDNIDYYLDIIEDEKNIEAIKLCLSKLSKILKHIKPQNVKGNLHIGFEDPYSMGQMLTIYGILYPIIHDKIQLEPEYDTNVVEGDINISGRIRLAVLAWTAFKIYFNKDVRRLLKKLKQD